MINREIFYNNYHLKFGILSQSQTEGLNFLLDKLDASEAFSLKTEYAYILATIFHECASRWQPVTEMGSEHYLRSKRYYPFIGRGYVQLTWDFNYRKFGNLLGIDLEGSPALALEPETAWQILETGMSKGMYTGRKLSDYVNENSTDYAGARKVINGTDQQYLVAGYAEKLECGIVFDNSSC